MREAGNCLGFFSRNTCSKNHPGLWLRKLLQGPMLTESSLDSSAGHLDPSSPTMDTPNVPADHPVPPTADASKSYFGLSRYCFPLVWLPNFSSRFGAQQSLFCVAFLVL